jgi:LmbE family N-acetylglucosaminyl deacetylase
MKNGRKLMAILAHPDDESLGVGGILVKYANEGVATYLVTATRGERGWFGDQVDYPGPQALGQLREEELVEAGRVLGLREVNLLDYVDGELDQAAPDEVIGKLVDHLRRVRPHVVVTFDPTGVYGHPDHIAISQFTTAAVLAAADPDYISLTDLPSHRVSKLYYLAVNAALQATYQHAFGDLSICIDGIQRQATPWMDWAITTRVDTAKYSCQVWDAISCHCSQLPGYQVLETMSEAQHRELWGLQTFYRALSMVNGGRNVEDDLFAGLN